MSEGQSAGGHLKKFEGEARVTALDADYEHLEPALDRMIKDLDLDSWLHELKGKRVFVKPNMLGVFEPERHVTTSPALVRAVVRRLREVGAEVTVGDNCGVGGYGLNQRVAKRTGIGEASEGAYVNVAKDTIQVPFKSRFLEQMVVSRAMVEADVLIMDEPTLGLDVLTNRVVLDFIRAEGARGKAIILSTHYLDDAEAICDEFGLIHNGKLVGTGDLAALRAQSGRSRLSEVFLKLCGEDEHVLTGAPEIGRSTSTQEAGE